VAEAGLLCAFAFELEAVGAALAELLGGVVDAITLARADGEAAVRVPRAMLVAAAERLERP